MEMVGPQDHFLSWARKRRESLGSSVSPNGRNKPSDGRSHAGTTIIDSCELADSRTIPNSLVDLVNSKHLTLTAISAL